MRLTPAERAIATEFYLVCLLHEIADKQAKYETENCEVSVLTTGTAAAVLFIQRRSISVAPDQCSRPKEK